MNSGSLTSKASRLFKGTLRKDPFTPHGQPGQPGGNRFFQNVMREFNFRVEDQPFKCIDMRQGAIRLSAEAQNFEAFISPYTLAVRRQGGTGCRHLQLVNLKLWTPTGKILLLHGEIAKEQLMPKNFVFYNPEEHQRIYRMLEEKQPAAVISATTRNPELVGAVYPFPMFEDGDFDIPSAYMTDVEGERLAIFRRKTSFTENGR